jgi:hypothetical protein
VTITNEPTTIPEVPAWLNLDTIATTETREAIARTLTAVKRNLDTMRECATGVRIWVNEMEEHGRGLPDDVFTVVLELTGVRELEQLARDIAHIFDAAASGTANDQAVLERLDEIDSDDYREVQP